MFNSSLNYECKTLAETFILAGRNKWGSEDFAKQLFNTQWGINILNGTSIFEYVCPNYMYEGLEIHLKKNGGKIYPDDILWYAGYLYRYLMENTTEPPSNIYEKAPIALIDKRYDFYHTQDWEYVRLDLGIN